LAVRPLARSVLLIIKGVPGDVCENCGEYYLSESITERVLSIGEEAVAKGAGVEIVRYAALVEAPEPPAGGR